MIILVNYSSSNEKAEAKKIINKICESYGCEFFDLEERISYGDTSIPSLEFTMLKNALNTDIPAIGTDVVIDHSVLLSIIENFDSFQIDFINKMLQMFEVVSIYLYKNENVLDVPIDSSNAFSFCIDKEFFVDLKKKLDSKIEKAKNNPFCKLLNGIDAYGFYLGSCDLNNPPTKAIILPGGAGQKISYEEYSNWVLNTLPLKTIEQDGLKSLETEGESFAFVRQHHPVELIAKKIVKQK